MKHRIGCIGISDGCADRSTVDALASEGGCSADEADAAGELSAAQDHR